MDLRRRAGISRHSPGNALLETALLSIFVYTPLLLMVVVLGEFGLARTGAHVAAMQASWLPEDVPEDEIATYFPGTLGGGTPALEFSTSGYRPAPQFTADGPGAEDMTRDLQAMFFAMAIGELHQTMRMENGVMVAGIIQEGDSVSQYLKSPRVVDPDDTSSFESGIVKVFEIVIPESVTAGQEISIIGSMDPNNPTDYVVAIQKILNGPLHSGEPWMLDAAVGLRYDYESGLLDVLDREPTSGEDMNQVDDVLTVNLQTIDSAPGELTEAESANGVAPGYVRCPTGRRVSDYLLYDIENSAPELFRWRVDGVDVNLSNFGPSPDSISNVGVENFAVPGKPGQSLTDAEP